MAQAQLTPLEQAALNVQNKIVSLKAMAPNDYNQQQRLIDTDVELKKLETLVQALSLQGFLSLFSSSFFFPALISNFASMIRPPSPCSFPRIGPVLAIYAKLQPQWKPECWSLR